MHVWPIRPISDLYYIHCNSPVTLPEVSATLIYQFYFCFFILFIYILFIFIQFYLSLITPQEQLTKSHPHISGLPWPPHGHAPPSCSLTSPCTYTSNHLAMLGPLVSCDPILYPTHWKSPSTPSLILTALGKDSRPCSVWSHAKQLRSEIRFCWIGDFFYLHLIAGASSSATFIYKIYSQFFKYFIFSFHCRGLCPCYPYLHLHFAFFEDFCFTSHFYFYFIFPVYFFIYISFLYLF